MEQTPETSIEVSIIEKLNANNLPELIGWKEKQETLLKENPYVEITDSKTYELACKSRTNLLKGRTELEKQDKAIASKVAAFRKEVGSKTTELIEITLSAEQTQQNEVKRWEGIKEAEKAEKERLENERINAIKNKAVELESLALEVIQKMTYETLISGSDKVSEIMHTEFDFEEFDILYTNAFSRVRDALDQKIKDLTQRETERLETIRLQEENAEAKRKSDLQASRLNEILPYVAFGSPIDLTKLSEMDDDEYEGNLSSKKGLFEADAIIKQEAFEIKLAKEKEQEEKAKKEKDATFEIRKNRLAELGIEIDSNGENFVVVKYPYLNVLVSEVYNYDFFEFEEFIKVSKSSIEFRIEKEKEIAVQKEADEKASKADAAKLKAENKARIKRLADDKNWLSGELEKYFSLAPLEYLTENQETKDFIKSASERIEALKSELLNELQNI